MQAIASHTHALSCTRCCLCSIATAGALQAQLGDSVAALADFDAALARNPASSQARFNRASVLHLLGEIAQALQEYTAVYKRRPDVTVALRNRGAALLHAGQFDAGV